MCGIYSMLYIRHESRRGGHLSRRVKQEGSRKDREDTREGENETMMEYIKCYNKTLYANIKNSMCSPV